MVQIHAPAGARLGKPKRQPAMAEADADADPDDAIVILGAGPAGLAAAQTLREEGFTGPITMISEESELPYDRVKLSKVLGADPKPLRGEEWFEQHNILHRHPVVAVEVNTAERTVYVEHVENTSSQTFRYSKLLCATGGFARTFSEEQKRFHRGFSSACCAAAAPLRLVPPPHAHPRGLARQSPAPSWRASSPCACRTTRRASRRRLRPAWAPRRTSTPTRRASSSWARASLAWRWPPTWRPRAASRTSRCWAWRTSRSSACWGPTSGTACGGCTSSTATSSFACPCACPPSRTTVRPPRARQRRPPRTLTSFTRSSARATGTGRVCGVTFDGETIPADLVVVGAGIIPSTGYLDEAEGVQLNPRGGGVIVDEHLRACEDVYAAGDIAAFPYWAADGEITRVEHWDVAIQQGRIAARNMLGKGEPFRTVPFFWTQQYGAKIRVRYAGHAREWDEQIFQYGKPTDDVRCEE